MCYSSSFSGRNEEVQFSSFFATLIAMEQKLEELQF